MDAKDSKNGSAGGGRREKVTGIVLALCMMVVGTWLVLARLAEGPYDPYATGAASFEGFAPALEGFDLRRLEVGTDPTEPNILNYELKARQNAGGTQSREPVLVRLVHGYNMPDCMRIKGYRVELVAGGPAAGVATNNACQVWRLTGTGGEVSIWVTSMLRAADLAYSETDIRSMAFPKVDVPDDPNWVPTGISWADLRHPVAAGRQLVRTKWNGARCDVLTFLRLKKPAIPDDRFLSLVTAWQGPPVGGADEAAVAGRLTGLHYRFGHELQSWLKSGKATNFPAARAPDPR